MPRLIFAIPGDLATLTGGYAYDRRVLAELPALGLEALHVALPGRFPAPTAADIAAARAAIVSVLREGDVVLVDGLALGAMGDALSRLPAPVVELCHHPLALEAGLAPNAAERLRMSERAAADTVPDGAGLKVQPGDVAALRDALRDMIADGTLRDTLAAGAHAAGLALPRWSDTAATIADVTRRLAGEEVHTSGIGLRNSTIPSS